MNTWTGARTSGARPPFGQFGPLTRFQVVADRWWHEFLTGIVANFDHREAVISAAQITWTTSTGAAGTRLTARRVVPCLNPPAEVNGRPG